MSKIAILLLLCDAASSHAAPFSEGDPLAGAHLSQNYYKFK